MPSSTVPRTHTRYWELPYLLPFNSDGTAIDNYHHEAGETFALMFGYSSIYANAYYVGRFDSHSAEFVPFGAASANVSRGEASSGSHHRDTGSPPAAAATTTGVAPPRARPTVREAPTDADQPLLAAGGAAQVPTVVGAWPLANGSGAATVGPPAVLTNAVGVGSGTEFFAASRLAIPCFRALVDPTAAGGLSISFMIQLNGAGA